MAPLPPFDTFAMGASGLVVAGSAALELLQSRRFPNLRNERHALGPGFADVLLYRALVRPGVIKLASGAYLAMLRMRAPDAGSYDEGGLTDADLDLARVFTQLTPRTVMHLHEHRSRQPEYDVPNTYPHPLLHFLDERRSTDFLETRPPYQSQRTVSLAWLPPSDRTERITAATTVGGKARAEAQIIDDFERRIARFAAFARSYADVHVLGEVTERDQFGVERTYSEPLEHLMWCLYGRRRRVCVPDPAMPLGALLVNTMLAEEFRGGYTPRIGGQELRIIFVDRVPDRTRPMLFSRLHEMQIDYGLCVRFIPYSGAEAQKEIGGAYGEWLAAANARMTMVNPHALAMAKGAEQALGVASSGELRFGRTTISIVLRAPTAAAVDAAAQSTVALLDEIGYPAFSARTSAEDGFYGYLPGDPYHVTRKYPLHALNITQIFSFHEESLGRRYNESPTFPPDTIPLAYLRTRLGDSAYRLQLNTDPRDTFDHIGVGKKGSGKSVLLAFLLIEWLTRLPYTGATVVDRGRSLYRLARFLDAGILDLPVFPDESVRDEHGYPIYPGFALFGKIEDPEERLFLLELLKAFLEMQSVAATPRRMEALEFALTQLETLPRHLRDLTAFVELVQDPEGVLRPAIRQYTRASALGSTLDTPNDTMRFSRLTMIEIGRLQGLSRQALVPIYKTAFWKARASVAQRKRETNNYDWQWLFEFDEAKTLLDSEQGAKFVFDTVKQGRKEKYTCGFWGQVPSDFTESSIFDDLLSACGTRFYFRDVNATDPRVAATYAKMTLPSEPTTRLASLGERIIMMHQPTERELQELRLDLDPVWLAIIGRSRDTDNRRLDEYMARYPNTWREEILRYEGVDRALIARFLELLEHYRNQTGEWDQSEILSLLK